MPLSTKFASLLAIVLASLNGAALAAPKNDGTITPTTTTSTVSAIATPVSDWGGHNTVQPTVCNLYPTGTTIVHNGTTTSIQATVYATGVPPSSTTPTSSAVAVLEGRDNDRPTTTTTVTYSTPTTTTLWPDATNGGVYINQTITSTRAGGEITLIASTGYAWPTVCSFTPVTVRPTAPGVPEPSAAADSESGGESEALKSTTNNNGAAALGAPAMMLGAVAGVFVLAL